jgi:hypothetical protein
MGREHAIVMRVGSEVVDTLAAVLGEHGTRVAAVAVDGELHVRVRVV